MKKIVDMLTKACASFDKKHDFKSGMAVRQKKELSEKNDNAVGVFMHYLPNAFGGDNDSPTHMDNFIIADCVVMVLSAKGGCHPSLSDSRFLEPVIEEDETQRQLELPLDATQ
jgi:hypothetical protein